MHTKKIPLAADLDLERIASLTPGMSGADLSTLINEGTEEIFTVFPGEC